MNTRSYTEFNENSTHNFLSEDDTYDAMLFLKEPQNFRSFDEGLKELLQRKGLDTTNKNPYELADFLFDKLCQIGSSISRTTVEAWFLGEHRPKIESGYRKQIYEICFAMNLSYEETIWFFQHVYYDRAFNCHTIEESVYYYATKNHLSYTEALEIINEINNTPVTPSDCQPTANYTHFVQQHLSEIESTDELISFLTLNKENFDSWNQSALAELNNRLSELIPTEKGKKEIDNIKRTIKRKNSTNGVIPKLSQQKEWGLIMQEFFADIDDPDSLSDIDGNNIRSNTFVLLRILYTSVGLPKYKEGNSHNFNDPVEIPYIVKNNFPSKKIMSDVLSENKMAQSKSYDAIRKMIILLYFYSFWVKIKLGYVPDSEADCQLCQIFVDEIDAILFHCGYEGLYAGNPYDWLFLCASRSQEPLEYLRACVLNLIPDEE